MARTLQQQLDALDTLIAQIEADEGIESLGTGERQMRRAQLLSLYAERRALQREVNAQGGANFHLAEPFEQ